MWKMLQQLWSNERGQDIAEYVPRHRHQQLYSLGASDEGVIRELLAIAADYRDLATRLDILSQVAPTPECRSTYNSEAATARWGAERFDKLAERASSLLELKMRIAPKIEEERAVQVLDRAMRR